MQTARLSTGITVSYQDEGNKSHPTIIMIMGLGAQMTVWPDELYFGLVNKGFRVIRFDNRDVGKSSQLNQHGTPSILKTWLSTRLPIKNFLPYSLEDMSDDVIALMTVLNIKKAHVVGSSMGGMIAQILAANHRKKVLSMTNIMSSPQSPGLEKANFKMLIRLAKRPNRFNREAAIKYNIKLNRMIGSPKYPIDDSTLHQHATFHVDRGYNPEGFKRQLAAVTASGCRRHLLKQIKANTLIIHGSDDPVIPVSHSKELASHIKKHKVKIVQGMGHDFPPVLMKKLTKWISRHINKAEQKRAQRKLSKTLEVQNITTK